MESLNKRYIHVSAFNNPRHPSASLAGCFDLLQWYVHVYTCTANINTYSLTLFGLLNTRFNNDMTSNLQASLLSGLVYTLYSMILCKTYSWSRLGLKSGHKPACPRSRWLSRAASPLPGLCDAVWWARPFVLPETHPTMNITYIAVWGRD